MVTFEPTSLKPATAPTLGKYSIKDDATNIKAALDDATKKALLEDTKNCSGITVEDTVKNITDVAMPLAAVKGSIAATEISVKDSLQALSSLTETMRNALKAVDNTVDYVVSDTDKADLKLSNTTLDNLNGLSPLDLSALKTLNISAVAKDETNGLNLSDTTFIGDTFTGKVNFTGSDVKDEIADWKFNADTIELGDGDDSITTISKGEITTIDAGAGKDEITVEVGKSDGLTVNLGKDDGNADKVTLKITTAPTSKDDNSDAAVLINDFGTGDKIAFAGLTGFDNTIAADKITNVSIQGVLTTKQIYLGDGSNPVANDLATFKALFDDSGTAAGKIKALSGDEEVIMVTKATADSTKLNLWYVKGVTDSGTATADNDIIVLLGTVDNGTNATLTADNIAHA